MSTKLPVATGSWGEKKVTLGNATYMVAFLPHGREYRVEERKGNGGRHNGKTGRCLA